MHNPLEQFAIQKFVSFSWHGFDLSFTNASLAMVISAFIIVGLGICGTRPQKDFVPTPFQAFVEKSFDFVSSIMESTLGEKSQKFAPLIMSLFFFIFMGNAIGLIPGAFTFTSHIIVTFAMALFIFLLATILGIFRFGFSFFKRFFPHGAPILIAPLLIPVEILSYFSRPISLSVRLFANMLAGHMLLKIFAGFCVMLGAFAFAPAIFNTVFLGFEFFVAGLQAYIFTILTCVYIQDALEQH